MKKSGVLAIVMLFFFFALVVQGKEIEKKMVFNTNILPFGNEENKFDLVKVFLNSVFSSRLCQCISGHDLFDELSDSRIVLVGESHTNESHHKIQLKVISGLSEMGKPLVLALEMFPPSYDKILEEYISGQLSEEEFLTKSGWFKVWGHNYRYYKPILDYARQRKIPVRGVNIPHEFVSKIRMFGFQGLSEDEKKCLPELDKTSPEHRYMVNAMMDGIGVIVPSQSEKPAEKGSDDAHISGASHTAKEKGHGAPTFENLYEAQCLWDAAMADGAIKLAKEKPPATVVLLAGTGHIAYNLGIARIIKKRTNLSCVSVLAVDIENQEQESKHHGKEKLRNYSFQAHFGKSDEMSEAPSEIVSRGLADYLIGISEETREKYPTLGFGIKKNPEGKICITMVFPATLGDKHGLSMGDEILSINGSKFESVDEMKRFLSFLDWGDKVSFKLRRNRKVKTIRFTI